jgi:hypothetical protein
MDVRATSEREAVDEWFGEIIDNLPGKVRAREDELFVSRLTGWILDANQVKADERRIHAVRYGYYLVDKLSLHASEYASLHESYSHETNTTLDIGQVSLLTEGNKDGGDLIAAAFKLVPPGRETDMRLESVKGTLKDYGIFLVRKGYGLDLICGDFVAAKHPYQSFLDVWSTSRSTGLRALEIHTWVNQMWLGLRQDIPNQDQLDENTVEGKFWELSP